MLMMEGCAAFDARGYHQFPNYHEMESEYMRYLAKNHDIVSSKEQASNNKIGFIIHLGWWLLLGEGNPEGPR